MREDGGSLRDMLRLDIDWGELLDLDLILGSMCLREHAHWRIIGGFETV